MSSTDDGKGAAGGADDEDDEDDGMDDEPTDGKQELWMRAIVDYDGKIDGHIAFKEGDVLGITDSSGPMMCTSLRKQLLLFFCDRRTDPIAWNCAFLVASVQGRVMLSGPINVVLFLN
jgi:hypothetical protein